MLGYGELAVRLVHRCIEDGELAVLERPSELPDLLEPALLPGQALQVGRERLDLLFE